MYTPCGTAHDPKEAKKEGIKHTFLLFNLMIYETGSFHIFCHIRIFCSQNLSILRKYKLSTIHLPNKHMIKQLSTKISENSKSLVKMDLKNKK